MAATLLLLLQVGHHILTFAYASGTDGLPPPLEITTSLHRTLKPFNYTLSKPITVERAWDFLYRNWIILKALKKQQQSSTAFPAEDADILLKQLDVYYRMTLDPTNPDVPENILFSLNIEKVVDDHLQEVFQTMHRQLSTLGGPYLFPYHHNFDYAYRRYRLYYALLQRHFRQRGHQGQISLKELEQSLISLGNKLKAYSDHYQLTSDTPVETDLTRDPVKRSSFNQDITEVRDLAIALMKSEPETDSPLLAVKAFPFTIVKEDTGQVAAQVPIEKPVVAPEATSQLPAVKPSLSSIFELPHPTSPKSSKPKPTVVSQPKKVNTNRLLQLAKNPYFLTIGTIGAVALAGAAWYGLNYLKRDEDDDDFFVDAKYIDHATFEDHVRKSGTGWIVVLIVLVILVSGGVAVWLYYRRKQKEEEEDQGDSSKGEDPAVVATDSPSPTTSVKQPVSQLKKKKKKSKSTKQVSSPKVAPALDAFHARAKSKSASRRKSTSSRKVGSSEKAKSTQSRVFSHFDSMTGAPLFTKSPLPGSGRSLSQISTLGAEARSSLSPSVYSDKSISSEETELTSPGSAAAKSSISAVAKRVKKNRAKSEFSQQVDAPSAIAKFESTM